jgi:hypothetical protein
LQVLDVPAARDGGSYNLDPRESDYDYEEEHEKRSGLIKALRAKRVDIPFTDHYSLEPLASGKTLGW